MSAGGVGNRSVKQRQGGGPCEEAEQPLAWAGQGRNRTAGPASAAQRRNQESLKITRARVKGRRPRKKPAGARRRGLGTRLSGRVRPLLRHGALHGGRQRRHRLLQVGYLALQHADVGQQHLVLRRRGRVAGGGAACELGWALGWSTARHPCQPLGEASAARKRAAAPTARTCMSITARYCSAGGAAAAAPAAGASPRRGRFSAAPPRDRAAASARVTDTPEPAADRPPWSRFFSWREALW